MASDSRLRRFARWTPPRAKSLLDSKDSDFKFDEKHWAELAPCTMNGERKDGVLVVSADTAACSALLPGLGGSAGLLPLKLTFDGEMLTDRHVRRSGARSDRIHRCAARAMVRRMVGDQWRRVEGEGR